MWNDMIIELTNGRINEDNIDSFNCKFFSAVDENHDSDTEVGTPCRFKVKVDGMIFRGSYTATWIGDDEYPDETIPADIYLESIDGKQVTEEGYVA